MLASSSSQHLESNFAPVATSQESQPQASVL
jgi:hypothetical protein